ncbi:MAG: 50S ribosomal protein L11 methyltransferase [Bacteroidales bacterium]|nr:50S ribosomal protein L11 methyltransferase [Bacteroidales bacterium]
MKYIEVTLHFDVLDPFRDLAVYALGDEGPYDSFVETPDGVKAYVPAAQYDAGFLQRSVEALGCTTRYEVCAMPDKDWNAEWEKNHRPVLVDDFCWVRAPFHPHRDDVPYEIEIEPKMSFGTAHHATTYMMMRLLRDEDVQQKRVLDMGCGTAVLAILAAKRGAQAVEAVDIDEWAFRNAEENVRRNGCQGVVHCRMGDAGLLSDLRFDLVLANINLNILLRDMGAYAQTLLAGGVILFSGFYESDIDELSREAARHGLRPTRSVERDGWAAVRMVKEA